AIEEQRQGHAAREKSRRHVSRPPARSRAVAATAFEDSLVRRSVTATTVDNGTAIPCGSIACGAIAATVGAAVERCGVTTVAAVECAAIEAAIGRNALPDRVLGRGAA